MRRSVSVTLMRILSKLEPEHVGGVGVAGWGVNWGDFLHAYLNLLCWEKIWLLLMHWYITLSCWRIAGRAETIGCYRFGGQGTFNDALTTCNNTRGYLVGIDTALEKRAVAGENRNDSWVIFVLFTDVFVMPIDIQIPEISVYSVFTGQRSFTQRKHFALLYSVNAILQRAFRCIFVKEKCMWWRFHWSASIRV